MTENKDSATHLHLAQPANPFDAASEHFADSHLDAFIDYFRIIRRNLELAGQAGALLKGDLSTGHISDVLQTIHNFDLRNFVYGLYCDAFYREEVARNAALRYGFTNVTTYTELTIGSDWARVTLWDRDYTHLATVYSYGTSDWGHENRDGNSNRL